MLYLRSVALVLLLIIFCQNIEASSSDGTTPTITESFDYEYLSLVAQNRNQTPQLLVNNRFYEFVDNLSYVPNSKLKEAFHILRHAVDNYISYTATIQTDLQYKIVLSEILRVTKAARKFFELRNNQIASRYFTNVSRDLPELILNKSNSEDRAKGEIIDTTKNSLFKINEEAILKNNLEYKVDIKQGEVTNIEYKDTILELSVRELPVSKSEGNIAFLASKNARKKAFSIRVTTPTQNTSEALFMTTKHLLSHPKVYGVLFEDFLRVPSEMQSIAHERRALGDKILLVRPACSGLFSP